MIDPIAFTETYYIINKMSDALKSKIPKDLIELITKSKDNNYKFECENLQDIKLHKDTEKLLSVIYTDYIATDYERKIIKNKEKFLYLKEEKEKAKKYDINVFNNNNLEEQNKQVALVVQGKEKWYQKILTFIRKIFK